VQLATNAPMLLQTVHMVKPLPGNPSLSKFFQTLMYDDIIWKVQVNGSVQFTSACNHNRSSR